MKLKGMQALVAPLMLALMGNAGAVNLNLDFNSLPSAQGWQLVNSTGLSESDVFSVDGTSLTQHTIGTGVSGYAYYQVPNILDLTKSYSFDVRARILAEEFSSPGAFSFAATASGWYSLVGLGMTNISIVDAGPNPLLTIDGSSFHDYHLTVSTGGAYQLFVDGILQHSGTVDTAALPNLVYFGDVGTGVNGHVEITSLSFQQPAAPVPEPASVLLMLSGLGCLAARKIFGAKSA